MNIGFLGHPEGKSIYSLSIFRREIRKKKIGFLGYLEVKAIGSPYLDVKNEKIENWIFWSS